MPSHRALSEEATNLAIELGLPISTAGLTHREVQDLVDELKQRKEQQQAQKPPPAPKPIPPPAPTAKPPPTPVSKPKQAKAEVDKVVVADGTSLTSLRGVLGPGTAVTAVDFSGGQQTIDDLLANGSLVSGQADGDGAA